MTDERYKKVQTAITYSIIDAFRADKNVKDVSINNLEHSTTRVLAKVLTISFA